MFDRKKVQKLKMTEAGYTSSDKSGNQADYERKVNEFLKYCNKFEDYLRGQIYLKEEDKKIITAETVKIYFNFSFREYYSKLSKRLSLFSRTTRVLKEMDKKLKKLGNLEINLENDSVAKLRDAFEYRREMPTGKLIKRSTIDDKAVYGFFNGTVPKIINELASDAKEVEDVELGFIEKSLENAKFENRFKVLGDKIGEIKNDLNEIDGENGKRKKYPKEEKVFEKNDNFIVKIREEVKKVKGKIDDSGNKFKEEKGNLKKYKESTEDEKKKFKFNESEYKKLIHNIKNDVEQYSEEVKKLKSDTEKAIKEFNKIASELEENKKFLDSNFILTNGTLIIYGDKGLKVYWKIYNRNYSKERDKFTAIKKIVLNDVSSINIKNIFNLEQLTSVEATSLSGKICDYAFCYCKNLCSFNSANGNGYNYNIPNNVKTIGNYAFFGAGANSKTGFSANVGATTINSYAFAASGLKEIILPNVTKIGQYAFSGCGKLKVILGSNINANKVNNNAFDNTNEVTIYVRTEKLQKELKKKFSNVNVEIEKQI